MFLWKNINKRKPKKNGYYLIDTSDGTEIGRFIDGYFYEYAITGEYKFILILSDATHWRKLPERKKKIDNKRLNNDKGKS